MHEETFRQLRALLAALEQQIARDSFGAGKQTFPALLPHLDDSRDLLASLQEDHEELKCMLDALTKTLGQPQGPMRNQQITVQLRDFAELLSIHIRKEESFMSELTAHGSNPCKAAAPTNLPCPAPEVPLRDPQGPNEKGETE